MGGDVFENLSKLHSFVCVLMMHSKYTLFELHSCGERYLRIDFPAWLLFQFLLICLILQK